MNKKVIMGGAVVIFVIGAVIGNYAIKLMRQPPEPSTATQSLIGTALPQFSMLGLDGVREDVSQWQGKVRVINFWATWCPPCKREIPAMVALQESYGRQGLQIVGIALDNSEAVSEYVKESGINYPILLGDEAIGIAEKLGNDMGVLPYTVIVDQLGNVAYVHYGEMERDALENEIKKLL
jgi:thiol-disulfide isomerase/thioredoxin